MLKRWFPMTTEKSPQSTFLHVDMDAFFASIAQRDDPSLKGKPVIIGAPPDKRGVVSTCSYEARVFGVHSAMPSRTAYKLCPQGIFLPVDGKAVREAAKQIRCTFRSVTPLVEPLSIDEAFLDVTGSLRLHGDGRTCGLKLKSMILEETGLTASVGIAHNKFLAKLCSDLEKPDGLTVAPSDPEAVKTFLAPLGIRRIWGIGKKAEEKLTRYNLRTVKDLQEAGEQWLMQVLGRKSGEHIYQLALGIDHRSIVMESDDKSVSNEHTFLEDTINWDKVRLTLDRLAQKVGRRMRQKGVLGQTVHIKVRWTGFETLTRQTRIIRPTHTDLEIMDAAQGLLEKVRQEEGERPVRLIGIGVSDLRDSEDAAASWQPDLFGEVESEIANHNRQDQLDHLMDSLRDKFGDKIIRRGE